MIFRHLKIPDLISIEPQVFTDSRGFFFESYNQKLFNQNGISENFVQDNNSISTKGVLRGLHFQKPPFSQAKLVWVVSGKVFDVAVDIRSQSPTYGQFNSIILSGLNHKMFFIPSGFAHGFCVLSKTAHFFYKCSDFYSKESEGGILWNDPKLNIPWPVSSPVLSEKDQNLPTLKTLEDSRLSFPFHAS